MGNGFDRFPIFLTIFLVSNLRFYKLRKEAGI